MATANHFARMRADPVVMEHMIRPLTRTESDALVDRIERGFDEHGFGLWAVERAEGNTFMGFTGLSVPRFDAPFMPAVEVGWRLDRPLWGRGYATESARAAVEDGETRHDARPADDFDHPLVPPGHPIRRHVLYRLRAR